MIDGILKSIKIQNIRFFSAFFLVVFFFGFSPLLITPSRAPLSFFATSFSSSTALLTVRDALKEFYIEHFHHILVHYRPWSPVQRRFCRSILARLLYLVISPCLHIDCFVISRRSWLCRSLIRRLPFVPRQPLSLRSDNTQAFPILLLVAQLLFQSIHIPREASAPLVITGSGACLNFAMKRGKLSLPPFESNLA